uniref:BTB domain-containing protein n=1 Tax=Oryza meridionalis TaxID=40149 RepID=A0A0E0CED3_9ORYZ
MLDGGFIELKLRYEDLAAGDFVRSDDIYAGGHTWRVLCYPRGGGAMNSNGQRIGGEYLSIKLDLVTRSTNVRAIFAAFLVHLDGHPSPVHAKSFVAVYPLGAGAGSGGRGGGKAAAGWMYFASRSELEKKFVSGDGWVTVVCGVLIPSDSPQALSPPPPPPPPSSGGGGGHIGRLLYGAADDTADVALVVGGETFRAHRAVLAARSPVFKAALFGSMAEATAPSVALRDMDPAAFRAVLHFIYTDALPDDIDELAGFSPVDMFQHLLAAAERYELGGLKLLSTKKLLDNVTPENIAGIIVCAETHGCPELKKKCLDYLAREDEHFRKAATTQGYLRLLQDFPSLMDEIRATKNHAVGSLVCSDEFSAGGHLWRIECYPHGTKTAAKNGGEYVSLFVSLMSKSGSGAKAFFVVDVLNGGGTAFERDEKRITDIRDAMATIGGGIILESSRPGEELRSGLVTFICGIAVLCRGGGEQLAVPPKRIGEQLGLLLDSAEGSDVSFVVGGEKFAAHRAVLAARSPVFRAQLFGCMSDATSSCIMLQDMEPAIFRALLQFIYTDDLPGDTGELDGSPIDTFLQHLLAMADRYALDRLKLMCAQRLLQNMTADSVADILACAETYNCPELKNKCIDFFAAENNFKKAAFTDGFAVLLQKFPVIAAELKKRTKNLAAGDLVSSDDISAGGHLWRIECYPRGESTTTTKQDDNGMYVSLFLTLITKRKSNGVVKAIFEAFLLTRDGQPSSSDYYRRAKLHEFESNGEGLGWSNFVRRSDLEETCVVAESGRVTFVCGIAVADPLRLVVTPPPPEIGAHLGRLLDSGDGSDVTFIVGGETFATHRAVLAARSPVFRAELFGDMSESTSPSITLQEMEPATFRALLCFIYTDDLPGHNGDGDDDEHDGGSPATDTFQHLLAVADRYALDRLKLMCAQKLLNNMTADSVADVLALAETYSCPELKNKCIDFFAADNNFKKAVFTDAMANSNSVELELDYAATNVGDVVRSGVFSAGGHAWRVRCYPRGTKQLKAKNNVDDYISLFLELISKSSSNVKAIFDAFLIRRDGRPSSSSGGKRCLQVYPHKGHRSWGWTKFINLNLEEEESPESPPPPPPSSYMVDGKLRIMCCVIVLGDSSGDGIVAVPPPDIGAHLGRLLDHGDGMDVSFVVGGEAFPAHRAVLAARSPVFRAGLLGPMAEAKMSRITIH